MADGTPRGETPRDDRRDRPSGGRGHLERSSDGGQRSRSPQAGAGRGDRRRDDAGGGQRRAFSGDRRRDDAGGGERRAWGGDRRRDEAAGDRRSSFDDRRRDGAGSGERRASFGDRRGGAGERRRDGAPQGARRQGDRDARGGRPFEDRRRPDAERQRPAHNPRDLRAANRVDQERSPDIDHDVTGKELDRGTLKEIGGLDERPAEWVAKHLVMAGRYLEDDPALAFQHALAASRKGGRLSRVREAVALTAYAAGEYGDALREFRTYRRMTGDDTHIAAQVDSERALGRLDKALQLAAEVDPAELSREARVELVMVVSGVHEDLGDLQGAHDALQIPELDRRRGYPFSPRLFQRQADVLAALGRREEARLWARSVRVAEKALGIGGFAEPEIMDIEVEPAEEPDRGARAGDRGGARHGRADDRREDRPPRPASPHEEASVPDAADTGEAAPSVVVDHDPEQMALFDAPADASAEVPAADRASEDGAAAEGDAR